MWLLEEWKLNKRNGYFGEQFSHKILTKYLSISFDNELLKSKLPFTTEMKHFPITINTFLPSCSWDSSPPPSFNKSIERKLSFFLPVFLTKILSFCVSSEIINYWEGEGFICRTFQQVQWWMPGRPCDVHCYYD